MKALHSIAFILVVIGSLNWLIIGLFDYDVVMAINETVAQIVYILVGLSAIYLVVTHKQSCKYCVSSSNNEAM